jgi:hypothetical protein
MRATELLQEIAYPATQMAIVLAMVFFHSLFWLSERAGLFGLALLIVAVPAFLRYLVLLLEDRAHGRPAPVPSIETFSFWSDAWALTTLVPSAAAIAAINWLEYAGVAAANVIVGIIAACILPASFAVLAVTHSPVESLNPLALVRMVRACGPAYLVVPGTVLAITAVLLLLDGLGLPVWIGNVGTTYSCLLAFTLTGAVLDRRGIVFEVAIEASDEPDPESPLADLLTQRQKVAGHAYGFISRGNREGGLAHIRDWLNSEQDVSDAAQWFFNEMMRWESTDAALLFGHACLSHFLHHDDDRRALKLIASCLYVDPRWKPDPADRSATLELVRKYGRDDLEVLLDR